MHQHMGFKARPSCVRILKKSLYGRKQAPQAWYKRFAYYIFTFGLFHNTSDHLFFIYRQDVVMVYILLYVDNIILTSLSDALRKSIITVLSSESAMKDLGPVSYFLGIAVTRHACGLCCRDH